MVFKLQVCQDGLFGSEDFWRFSRCLAGGSKTEPRRDKNKVHMFGPRALVFALHHFCHRKMMQGNHPG